MLASLADGDRDPGGVRRAARCSSPASYVAIQVGRHAFLTFVAAGPRLARARAGAARILTWFVASGVLLDRRRRSPTARRGSRSGSSRSRSTTRAPLVALLGARAGRRCRRRAWEVETRALRRALPALHHHRARRVDRHHRRDDVRARRSTPARVTAFALAFLVDRGALVAVLRLRRADRASGGSSSPTTGRRLARDALHLPPRRRSSPGSSSRRSATSS